MNMPIRVLGIAIIVGWIILAIFIASAAYSIKDLNFDVGEPKFTTVYNNTRLELPLSIDNRGYYSLKNFNLTTVISDGQGKEISRAVTFLAIIPQNQNIKVLHNVSFDMHGLDSNLSQYLFEDTDLVCAITVRVSYAEIFPTQLTTNITIPWGAPFYDFKLGQFQTSLSNQAQTNVRVPLSFDNHAPFDLTGNIRVKLYDNQNVLLAETQTTLNTTRNSICRDYLDFSVPTTSATSSAGFSGRFEVYFSTPTFDYGPLVIPF